MEVELIPLEELTPFEQNPRQITEERRAALLASLASLGLFKPLLVWGDDNIIIGGNRRVEVLCAAQEAGELPDKIDPDAIPCVRFEGSEAEARTIAIRDNQHDGDWDWTELGKFVSELRALAGEEIDLSLTGFDDATLADLEAMASSGVQAAEDLQSQPPPDAPEDKKPKEPKEPKEHTLFSFGSTKGKVPNATYGRFLVTFDAVSRKIDSTDLNAVLSAMLDKVES